MTFEKYIDNQIKLYEKSQSFFPEHYTSPVEDVSSRLKTAIAYKEHLCDVKHKLETLYGMELSWAEFEKLQNEMYTIIEIEENKNYVLTKAILSDMGVDVDGETVKLELDGTLEFKVRKNMYIRRRFCEKIGVEFNEETADKCEHTIRIQYKYNLDKQVAQLRKNKETND